MKPQIRFYRATGEHGFMSNLYPCRMIFEGHQFDSAEHAYQYGKPKSSSVASWIAIAPAPRFASIVGHGLYPYDVVPDWSALKVPRMHAIVTAKFQIPKLANSLLATMDATLIEASKTDSFWGVGRKGNGQNMLGVILMEIRRKIAEGKDAQA